jgi:hypothetical protein
LIDERLRSQAIAGTFDDHEEGGDGEDVRLLDSRALVGGEHESPSAVT